MGRLDGAGEGGRKPGRLDLRIWLGLTEVNLWIIIDRYVDLLLCFGWTTIVCWWLIVNEGLESLLNELVAFIFEYFAVTSFTCVDSTTKVVIVRSWGARAGLLLGLVEIEKDQEVYKPVRVSGRPDVADSEFFGDFLDSEVENISFLLFCCHVTQKRSRHVEQTSSLVVFFRTPAILLDTLALLFRLAVCT